MKSPMALLCKGTSGPCWKGKRARPASPASLLANVHERITAKFSEWFRYTTLKQLINTSRNFEKRYVVKLLYTVVSYSNFFLCLLLGTLASLGLIFVAEFHGAQIELHSIAAEFGVARSWEKQVPASTFNWSRLQATNLDENKHGVSRTVRISLWCSD